MKTVIATALTVFGFANAALAMPCDLDYTCKSKSGRYKITIPEICKYDNSLADSVSADDTQVFIDGKRVKKAKLTVGWNGDKVLAFDIELPAQPGDQHILRAELSKTTLKGTIHDNKRDDAAEDYKTVRSEDFSCDGD